MNIKEVLKPTKAKLIAPAIISLIIVFYLIIEESTKEIICDPGPCVGSAENFLIAIITLFALVYMIVYFIVCGIAGIKRRKKS